MFGRSDIPGLRASLALAGLVAAEVDLDLRYVWVDNPHPDFNPEDLVGKVDSDFLQAEEAAELMKLKRECFETGEPLRKVIGFRLTDGWRFYCILLYPLRDSEGRIDGLFEIAIDTPGVLSGILPICMHCKKIRDDQQVWHQPESFFRERTVVEFSHGICPDCVKIEYTALLDG